MTFVATSSAQVRVKDVADVYGARSNMLTGMGLVVGLNNQGDTDPVSTRQMVSNMMRQFGITIDQANIKAKNSAMVMVTARIPAFYKSGAKLDVTVSSVADAKSLQGGTLLLTPLYGPDRKTVYAAAQGSLSIGGFAAGTSGLGGASLVKNHPTAGSIPGGALVEKEIPTSLFTNGVLEVNLRENDFTSAVRMANAINEQVATGASAISASTVKVYVPDEFQTEDRQLEFIARVENVIFKPDSAARIVIDERTGTIVANAHIRIDPVAVAHGNLTVSIVNNVNVSQPNAFTGNNIGNFTAGNAGNGGTAAVGTVGAMVPLTVGNNVVYNNTAGQQVQIPVGQTPPDGYTVQMVTAPPPTAPANGGTGGNVNVAPGAQTTVTGQDNLKVEEEKRPMVVFNELPTVGDVAAALNAMGVTPRDMIAIFQGMKQAGALQAELVLQGN